MIQPQILFEDNHILVVLKPANIPVQSDKSGDADMQSILKLYLAEKYQKPGNVFLGIVHRLDRPVRGVMVFGRTSKGASRLSESIRNRTFEKTYYAVVEGDAPRSKTLTHWLVKDTSSNMVTAFDKEVPGSKQAILHFERVGSTGLHSLLRIRLETGRPHQIRVQCAAMGFPLWGDQRYNKQAKTGQQIALFASELSFLHPVTKEKLRFASDLPKEFPWDQF